MKISALLTGQLLLRLSAACDWRLAAPDSAASYRFVKSRVIIKNGDDFCDIGCQTPNIYIAGNMPTICPGFLRNFTFPLKSKFCAYVS